MKRIKSHPVDIHAGARVRQRRKFLGMSQTTLAAAVGLSFQQVHNYECGLNRMGSSRLYEFAKVLDVPVSYFFDKMSANALSGRPMRGRGRKGFGAAATPFAQDKDPMVKSETLALVRAYYLNSRRKCAQAHFRDGQGSRWGQPCRRAGCQEAPGRHNSSRVPPPDTILNIRRREVARTAQTRMKSGNCSRCGGQATFCLIEPVREQGMQTTRLIRSTMRSTTRMPRARIGRSMPLAALRRRRRRRAAGTQDRSAPAGG